MVDSSLGRRASTRLEVELPATLTVDGVEHDCTVSNLSLGGVLLVSDLEMRMGDRVAVKFVIPTGDEVIDVIATVRWRTQRDAGLQFDGLRAREMWALGCYLKGQRFVA